MTEANSDPADRRAFYRVTTRIPVRHRPLHPGEHEALASAILAPRPEPEPLDPATASWVCRMEDKLDLILSHLDPAVPRPLGDRDLQLIEISASGMRFAAKEVAPIEEYELVELSLPGQVPRLVRAIARVVEVYGVEETNGEGQAALAFDVIREDDREAIVVFSNEVQRVAIRARASGEVG